MECCWDFIQWLGPDLSIKILTCLDDPTDLASVCTVSSSWRHFVIANGLSKQLCLRLFPEISSIALVIELKNIIEPVQSSATSSKWGILERDNRVYAFLGRGLSPFMRKNCISKSISASSTDNYPEESIQNTLEPGDRVEGRASYWSSKGENDPSATETLLYKLISKLCVITEVHVQPFQAFFQFGFPIYSPKAVRFWMGHSKYPEVESDSRDVELVDVHGACYDDFVWTYTSPAFPMAQENCLQKFKLPEPALCIGGVLAVELLGRVQRQEMDGLYYVCISHVQVVGRSLSTAFDVEVLDASGRFRLKYNPEAEHSWSPTRSPNNGSEREPPSSSTFNTFTASIRMWEEMFPGIFLGNGAVEFDDIGEEDDDEDLG